MTPGGARVDPVHQSNILGVSRAPRVVVGWKSTRRTTTAVIFWEEVCGGISIGAAVGLSIGGGV